jgi:hypothetical protein
MERLGFGFLISIVLFFVLFCFHFAWVDQQEKEKASNYQLTILNQFHDLEDKSGFDKSLQDAKNEGNASLSVFNNVEDCVLLTSEDAYYMKASMQDIVEHCVDRELSSYVYQNGDERTAIVIQNLIDAKIPVSSDDQHQYLKKLSSGN